MTDFLMPSLGADMESGTVAEWLVKPGSRVKKGDVVVVVETHKGAIEVEIFQEGVISELCVKEGETVPVGAPLARLTAVGEAAAAPRPAVPPPTPVPPAKPVVEVAPAPLALQPVPELVAPLGARKKITPAARRRAAERGIDPAALLGTGIDGSVTLADVEAAQPGPVTAVAPSPAARKPRAGFDPAEMRRAIAAAMSRSKREIPHYYLSSTIDLGDALVWLEDFNRERSPDARLLPAVLLLKAVALALRTTPQLNGTFENGAFRPGAGIHIGWAISLRGGGLVAPAIRDVDGMDLAGLMAALRDLVGRARSGGLRCSELTDATITVTSLGERGADTVMGVIYPPQVAIVGFGRIVERPFIAGGRVKKRPVISVSLAADHRASDGHIGGLLLSDIDRLLQEPGKL